VKNSLAKRSRHIQARFVSSHCPLPSHWSKLRLDDDVPTHLGMTKKDAGLGEIVRCRTGSHKSSATSLLRLYNEVTHCSFYTTTISCLSSSTDSTLNDTMCTSISATQPKCLWTILCLDILDTRMLCLLGHLDLRRFDTGHYKMPSFLQSLFPI
jgi:hypothetical protein